MEIPLSIGDFALLESIASPNSPAIGRASDSKLNVFANKIVNEFVVQLSRLLRRSPGRQSVYSERESAVRIDRLG